MSTSPNGYQTPKTNWQSADVVAASDFNRIEGNIAAIETGERTIDPAQAPSSNVGSLRQLLDWFANRIKSITGKTNWYDAPTKSLEQLNTDLSTHLVDDTIHQTAEQVRTASSKPIVVEVSSSAPSSPVNGQIWYDSSNHKFRGYANGAWV